MHAIHHTDAVILKSLSLGEANKRVWLFTEEFGLIVATVQGVRKGGAKLQGQISDYTFILADLIRGRDVWRLISARTIDQPLVGKLRNPLARAYVRTLSLLIRFLIEEGGHPELFNHIHECALVLKEGTSDARSFDALSIWKILVLLGYIAPNEDQVSFVEVPLLDSLPQVTDMVRSKLIRQSENAIAESQL
jgi:recombinational DNA repair protein (RecF pathway)